MIPAVQDIRVRVQQELGPAFPQLLREQVAVQRLRDAVDGDAPARAAAVRQVLQNGSLFRVQVQLRSTPVTMGSGCRKLRIHP